MTITLADFYCGAGGSSTGAMMVPGVELKAAINHWDRAIETHAANHPQAKHIMADVTQYEPSLFPRTTIAWLSPSCTKHSIAQGKKLHAQPDLFGEVLPDAAAERSRATMWDVVRFSEYHHYEVVIVENVVEVTNWPPYRAWLVAMDSLGYDHEVIMLNSMHAQLMGPGAPQSRDRFYAVFWRRGNRKPDLHRLTRPNAVCPECGPVRAMQSWKRADRPQIGKYRSQYVYRCPNVSCRNTVVEPIVRPAADIIDWSLEGQRIGDRARPLAEKTMKRIQAGIDRYWGPLIVEAAGNTYDAADPRHPAHGRADGYYRAWPTDDPLRTVHTTASKALVVPVEGREGKRAQSSADPMRTMTTRSETGVALPPFLTQFRDRVRDLDPARQPLNTVVADGANHMLVEPPFIAELRGGGSTARAVSDPLCTVAASGNHHALITRHYGNAGGHPARHTTPASEPVRVVTTSGQQSVMTSDRPTVDLNDVRFRMLEPSEIKRAMDFPAEYVGKGTRREQVRLWGNAVTPPAARDLVSLVVESLGDAA
ncbi:DNA cytosine methyltransferase [Tsukamurella tyrosinosolvens]|uniref:DNA cytosine methyltransferase n=1 Tax=Tsukamurella tyrosinosolvens TaxID=57704 RepID=UPI002DD4526F|nr:DNA cytosine methyltransferase [Tsukamurella tyrosinosolvens]MEC4616294.1 DNA cytosine methyltransferase [Tsukamurella tyrosinosolvens]